MDEVLLDVLQAHDLRNNRIVWALQTHGIKSIHSFIDKGDAAIQDMSDKQRAEFDQMSEGDRYDYWTVLAIDQGKLKDVLAELKSGSRPGLKSGSSPRTHATVEPADQDLREFLPDIPDKGLSLCV